MKKVMLFALFAGLMSNVASADVYVETVSSCDESEMRYALDRASYENRAVITIVECDNGVVRTVYKPKPVSKPCGCNACGCEMPVKEAVVDREYFVRETVQQYKPVTTYVPAGTYTRVKPVCNHGC